MTLRRKLGISAFVISWSLLFHYESLRYHYLNRWLGADLPKLKFLFPPAGWIMFYRVDDAHGMAEVYGRKGTQGTLIDPHDIFSTRWVGYDNIHRNVLISVLNRNYGPAFCRYLHRKFPEYEGFLIMQSWTPSVTREPENIQRGLAYRC